MFNSKYAIYSVAQIRELEKLAQEKYAFSEETLMQKAAEAALACLVKHWPFAKHIGIICGSGNNGGDGYLLAKLLFERGLDVKIWTVGSIKKLKPAALIAYESCKLLQISIEPLSCEEVLNVEVLIDALCGIGLSGNLKDSYRSAINQMNNTHLPILALDVPSGLNADSGHAEVCVHAKATVTFLGLKLGLLTGQGLNAAGEITADNLSLPAELFTQVAPIAVKTALNQYTHYLQPRPRDWHKGNAGHVLIIGGDEGMSGAVRLAGESALRSGAGLVTIATHPKHAALLNLTRPELMCKGIDPSSDLKSLLKRADVVVIGPGLGSSSWAAKLLQLVLSTDLPLIVDADALNLIAQEKQITRKNWILTPHPGEAARLLKQDIQTIQDDRIAAVQQLQTKFHGVAVLKGAGSLVASDDAPLALCTAGNPGMATAGMGDVLSGILGAFVAQGYPLADAAKLGVYVHARAGDLCLDEGERGMCALDLLPHVRALINSKVHRADP